MTNQADQDRAKQAAAEHAAGLVETGMRLGLGTGSTAERFVRALGSRIASEGLKVTGVATSERTSRLAQEIGIPLTTLDDAGALDLAVDGADEADSALRLIKGGGGALLREKLVASAARRTAILVDPSKQVAVLGRFPLPVEVVSFGARITLERIGALIAGFGEPGGVARLRLDNYGEPFVTDGGNLIVDAAFGAIVDPEGLARALDGLTGVVEHGLFLGLCDVLVVGASDGSAFSIKKGA
jgi:ribose 5-phosphate isomerase A